MDIDKNIVGRNIKDARAKNGLTQSRLAKLADMSQTQLSDYENGIKLPGLISLAKISRALNKSIDELCYGDASVSPITTAPDKGRLIVNCVYQLWLHGVLGRHIPTEEEKKYSAYFYTPLIADIRKYPFAIERLLESLDDYYDKKYTFSNPDLYLEQVFDSVSSEIDPDRRNQSNVN